MAEAPLGETLRATGNEERVEDAVWVEVVFGDVTGWAHSAFVVETARPTPTPLPTPTPVAGPDDLIVSEAVVRLRAEPRANSDLLRTLEEGTIVTPTGRTETGGTGRVWIEVRDNVGRGWARSDGFRSP